MKVKPELQIFPLRLMSDRTAKPMIDEIEKLVFVSKVGTRGFSSRDGVEYKVGWIWIEMDSDSDVNIESIEKICQNYIKFGYEIQRGRFTKYRVTTSDYLKGLVKEE